jgi:hypothetical protein
MSHSLLSIEKHPWVFLAQLFNWLICGTGMLLAPILQLAIFALSSALDSEGVPIPAKVDSKSIPDIEILPVGLFPLQFHLF